jgi:hypothetical protein
MAESTTGLFRRPGKCTPNPPGISDIRPELVFRRPQQNSAQNTNEISALRAELVFRDVPGELLQRRRDTQRFGGRILCVPLLNPVRGAVLRIPPAPVRLRLLTPRRPALRLRAGTLPVSHSRVRPKPLPTDPARSLPGLWHGELSSSPPSARESDQSRWVTFRKQRRVNSRARRSGTERT